MDTSDPDRSEILDLIEEETAAYFAKDYERWAQCWVQAPHVRKMGWYARGGVLVWSGWGPTASWMRREMEQFATPNRSATEVRRENFNVRLGRDIAWATFEQIAPKTGDAFDVPGRQYEIRIFEKQDGRWKIAACIALGSSLEFVDSPLVRLDDRSKVLWMNDGAAEQLKHHPGLVVSGGHLRARDRASNQRLQASIKWAANLQGYAAYQVAPSVGASRQIAMPVIVTDPDGSGPAEVCWLRTSDFMILLSFNDARTTEQRLEAAAVIYGITPAQKRIAALIIGGGDLVEAARQLNISVNTARTQLKRMFEKTGVSSQPALVRALLSVGSPGA